MWRRALARVRLSSFCSVVIWPPRWDDELLIPCSNNRESTTCRRESGLEYLLYACMTLFHCPLALSTLTWRAHLDCWVEFKMIRGNIAKPAEAIEPEFMIFAIFQTADNMLVFGPEAATLRSGN